MVERAARPLFQRLGFEPEGHIQLLMTNTLLPDTPITGCGAEAAHRLGFNPELIIDLHNGGCAAFPYMLTLAPAIMRGTGLATALLCTVQNTAGQVYRQPQASLTPQATVPGDGCGVAYLTVGAGSPVLAAVVRNDPASAQDMCVALDQRRYWESGVGEFNVAFNPDAFHEVLERGNALVPTMVRELCHRLQVQPDAIDILITNQPNRQFLRHWHQDLGIDPERHIDTFDRLGNLYGAGVMVTLDHAVTTGRIRSGDLVVVAGFAHAGDLAAAAAIRWRSPPHDGSSSLADSSSRSAR
jgi:3-oxoacyl-[acyl-carrier-protein] synthase-3